MSAPVPVIGEAVSSGVSIPVIVAMERLKGLDEHAQTCRSKLCWMCRLLREVLDDLGVER